MAVKLFVDVINIYHQLTLSKADYPPKCEWASPTQLKVLRARTEVSQRRSSAGSQLQHHILPQFLAASQLHRFLTCQPLQAREPILFLSLSFFSLTSLSLSPSPFFPAPIGSISPENPHMPVLSVAFPALRVTVTSYNCLSLELLPAPS